MSGSSVPILVWGAAGHAKVLRPILKQAARTVVAYVERDTTITSPFEKHAERLANEADVACWLKRHEGVLEYVLAMGGRGGRERMRLALWLDANGARPFTAIHSSAFVAETSIIGRGCHVLPLAAICEEVVLGPQCIVNTNASVDHESKIGCGVHIMPGATVAGCVTVRDFVTIGSNATVLPRVTICEGAIIGAGAVVTKNIGAGETVVGVPADRRLARSL